MARTPRSVPTTAPSTPLPLPSPTPSQSPSATTSTPPPSTSSSAAAAATAIASSSSKALATATRASRRRQSVSTTLATPGLAKGVAPVPQVAPSPSTPATTTASSSTPSTGLHSTSSHRTPNLNSGSPSISASAAAGPSHQSSFTPSQFSQAPSSNTQHPHPHPHHSHRPLAPRTAIEPKAHGLRNSLAARERQACPFPQAYGGKERCGVHEEDENDDVLMAVCAACASMGNLALSPDELATIAVEHGWIRQPSVAVAPSTMISNAIRMHQSRAQKGSRRPLLTKYQLSGSTAEASLAPALHPNAFDGPSRPKGPVWYLLDVQESQGKWRDPFAGLEVPKPPPRKSAAPKPKKRESAPVKPSPLKESTTAGTSPTSTSPANVIVSKPAVPRIKLKIGGMAPSNNQDDDNCRSSRSRSPSEPASSASPASNGPLLSAIPIPGNTNGTSGAAVAARTHMTKSRKHRDILDSSDSDTSDSELDVGPSSRRRKGPPAPLTISNSPRFLSSRTAHSSSFGELFFSPVLVSPATAPQHSPFPFHPLDNTIWDGRSRGTENWYETSSSSSDDELMMMRDSTEAIDRDVDGHVGRWRNDPESGILIKTNGDDEMMPGDQGWNEEDTKELAAATDAMRELAAISYESIEEAAEVASTMALNALDNRPSNRVVTFNLPDMTEDAVREGKLKASALPALPPALPAWALSSPVSSPHSRVISLPLSHDTLPSPTQYLSRLRDSFESAAAVSESVDMDVDDGWLDESGELPVKAEESLSDVELGSNLGELECEEHEAEHDSQRQLQMAEWAREAAAANSRAVDSPDDGIGTDDFPSPVTEPPYPISRGTSTASVSPSSGLSELPPFDIVEDGLGHLMDEDHLLGPESVPLEELEDWLPHVKEKTPRSSGRATAATVAAGNETAHQTSWSGIGVGALLPLIQEIPPSPPARKCSLRSNARRNRASSQYEAEVTAAAVMATLMKDEDEDKDVDDNAENAETEVKMSSNYHTISLSSPATSTSALLQPSGSPSASTSTTTSGRVSLAIDPSSCRDSPSDGCSIDVEMDLEIEDAIGPADLERARLEADEREAARQRKEEEKYRCFEACRQAFKIANAEVNLHSVSATNGTPTPILFDGSVPSPWGMTGLVTGTGDSTSASTTDPFDLVTSSLPTSTVSEIHGGIGSLPSDGNGAMSPLTIQGMSSLSLGTGSDRKGGTSATTQMVQSLDPKTLLSPPPSATMMSSGGNNEQSSPTLQDQQAQNTMIIDGVVTFSSPSVSSVNPVSPQEGLQQNLVPLNSNQDVEMNSVTPSTSSVLPSPSPTESIHRQNPLQTQQAAQAHRAQIQGNNIPVNGGSKQLSPLQGNKSKNVTAVALTGTGIVTTAASAPIPIQPKKGRQSKNPTIAAGPRPVLPHPYPTPKTEITTSTQTSISSPVITPSVKTPLPPSPIGKQKVQGQNSTQPSLSTTTKTISTLPNAASGPTTSLPSTAAASGNNATSRTASPVARANSVSPAASSISGVSAPTSTASSTSTLTSIPSGASTPVTTSVVTTNKVTTTAVSTAAKVTRITKSANATTATTSANTSGASTPSAKPAPQASGSSGNGSGNNNGSSDQPKKAFRLFGAIDIAVVDNIPTYTYLYETDSLSVTLRRRLDSDFVNVTSILLICGVPIQQFPKILADQKLRLSSHVLIPSTKDGRSFKQGVPGVWVPLVDARELASRYGLPQDEHLNQILEVNLFESFMTAAGLNLSRTSSEHFGPSFDCAVNLPKPAQAQNGARPGQQIAASNGAVNNKGSLVRPIPPTQADGSQPKRRRATLTTTTATPATTAKPTIGSQIPQRKHTLPIGATTASTPGSSNAAGMSGSVSPVSAVPTRMAQIKKAPAAKAVAHVTAMAQGKRPATMSSPATTSARSSIPQQQANQIRTLQTQAQKTGGGVNVARPAGAGMTAIAQPIVTRNNGKVGDVGNGKVAQSLPTTTTGMAKAGSVNGTGNLTAAQPIALAPK